METEAGLGPHGPLSESGRWMIWGISHCHIFLHLLLQLQRQLIVGLCFSKEKSEQGCSVHRALQLFPVHLPTPCLEAKGKETLVGSRKWDFIWGWCRRCLNHFWREGLPRWHLWIIFSKGGWNYPFSPGIIRRMDIATVCLRKFWHAISFGCFGRERTGSDMGWRESVSPASQKCDLEKGI